MSKVIGVVMNPPKTKSIVKPVTAISQKPIDPQRAKAEELVDAKLAEVIKRANENKGPYWKKISDFQLNYDGKSWKVIDSYDTGGYGDYEDCQLCGHKGCRFMYVIASGDKKLTIGDECVGNYIKDLDDRKIFKQHNKNLREKIGKTKSYRDLLVDLVLWESKNGTNQFLTNMKNRILNGISLSQNMVSAIKRTISKEKPKIDTVLVKKDNELYEKARVKSVNDWEKNFLKSIGEQLQKGYALSIKQIAILERIANYK